MTNKHIAVIDVGKTNKKILIFDEKLKIIESAYEKIEEYEKDGVRFEAVEETTAWFKKQLAAFAKKYAISAVSVTTHGATIVCIDADGRPAVPVVAYTTEADEEFQKEFYGVFGSPQELQKKTATARIGSLINAGKVLYFVKKRYPDGFKRIAQVLNYPQYFGYVLTGNTGAEPTYVGCHTYLFDFKKRTWSDVAAKLGILDKLPATIRKSWDVLGTISPSIARETGLPSSCIVTMGIHDSNASLLPFLVKGHRDFVLNSTGTWCVAMSPAARVAFKPRELGKLVFYNLDAFFNPVKTSIFMGGLEYETWLTVLRNKNAGAERPAYDRAAYQKLMAENRFFILPSVTPGTGIFPNARPRAVEDGAEFTLEEIQSGKRVPAFFRDFAVAHAALVISLVIQTRAAFDMVGFAGEGTIFTEGGFRRNEAYNRLLSALYPKASIFLTGLQEATAFGAAILARAALDKTDPKATTGLFKIEMTTVPAEKIDGCALYRERFMGMIS